METQQTHADILAEINLVMTQFKAVMEWDCIGDMIRYMDEYEVRYYPDATNERMRSFYKHGIRNRIEKLHYAAAALAETEIFSL